MVKQIVFAIKSLYGGGAQRTLLILSNEFKKNGYDVLILTMFNKVDYTIPFGVKHICLNIDPTDMSYSHNKASITDISSHINLDDVIFFVFSNSGYLYDYIVKFRKTSGRTYPIVAVLQNNPADSPSSDSLREYRNTVFQELSKDNSFFVFQTEFEKQYFPSNIQMKSVIIGTPIVDSLPLPYSGERRRTIVSMGRLTEQKNYHLLLSAFSVFIKKHPDYSLEIYGEGELRNELEGFAKQLDLPVFWGGFRKDVHMLINDAKMFVLASNYEGLSNAVLESLSLGLPTICTDCPAYGARSIIQNGINGLLVPPNDPKALLGAMDLLATDGIFCQMISRNAARIRGQQSTKTIYESYLEIINSVC